MKLIWYLVQAHGGASQVHLTRVPYTLTQGSCTLGHSIIELVSSYPRKHFLGLQFVSIFQERLYRIGNVNSIVRHKRSHSSSTIRTKIQRYWSHSSAPFNAKLGNISPRKWLSSHCTGPFRSRVGHQALRCSLQWDGGSCPWFSIRWCFGTQFYGNAAWFPRASGPTLSNSSLSTCQFYQSKQYRRSRRFRFSRGCSRKSHWILIELMTMSCRVKKKSAMLAELSKWERQRIWLWIITKLLPYNNDIVNISHWYHERQESKIDDHYYDTKAK